MINESLNGAPRAAGVGIDRVFFFFSFSRACRDGTYIPALSARPRHETPREKKAAFKRCAPDVSRRLAPGFWVLDIYTYIPTHMLLLSGGERASTSARRFPRETRARFFFFLTLEKML